MATIVQRTRKDGIAFLFQVKIKNQLTGAIIVKSKSWNPPKEMSAKQAEREAITRAAEYEKEIRAVYSNHNPDGMLTPDSAFGQVAAAWLEKIRKQRSITYYATAEKNLADGLAFLRDMKVSKITPAVLQSYFDMLDKRERVVYIIYSKPDAIRTGMKQRRETYTTLNVAHGFDQHTLCNALLRNKVNISMPTAKRFAEVLKTDVHTLFEIKETRQPYAYHTNHKIKAVIRAVLSYAKKKRIVVDNYAKAEFIDFPKRTQKEIQCMDESQVARVYNAIGTYPDIRHSTILLTLIFTGFRRGEVCGLKWENVDLENRRITIARSIGYLGSKYGTIEKDPKTEKSKRTIEIPNILNNQLIKYREWYLAEKAKLGDRWDNNDWIFVNNDGERISGHTILAWINKVFTHAGLGWWTVHSMRHTNITMKLMNNIPLLEVSAEAGHTRTSTTTDVYGHFLKGYKSQAAQMFDEKRFENIVILPAAK